MTISDEELSKLIAAGESDHMEFKQSLAGDTPKKIRQTVCAFANDLAGAGRGLIVVGLKDDGTPTGATVSDKTLRDLANIHGEGKILPPPSIDVAKHRFGTDEVAVIVVTPSDSPPVKYDGRMWVRVGSTNHIASEADERRLNEKRRHRDKPFDVQPVRSATIADLDLAKFQAYLVRAVAPDILAANERTVEQRLAAMKMTVSADDTTPTVLGLLVVGRKPTDFLPGAYVLFLRIDGTAMGDLARGTLDKLEAYGTVDEVIQRVEDKLAAHNRTVVNYVGVDREVRRDTYPLVAMQQLFRNAVMHRRYEGSNAAVRVYWFNDRIEIWSSGGPVGEINAKNFGAPGLSECRNPNLAAALRDFDLVQKFGSGIGIARDALKANGNPEPTFFVDTYVQVTLRPPPLPPAAASAVAPESDQWRGNLVPLTFPLIGRENEVQLIVNALTGHNDSNSKGAQHSEFAGAPRRVLTIVGPGGMGKTSVAVAGAAAVASSFSGGAWMCDLSAATTSDGVCAAIATSLGVQLTTDHPEEHLARVLRERGRGLYVLDNCEQVVNDVANLLLHLLPQVPEMMVLATSREPLHIAAETVLVLEPLALPQHQERDAANSPAVQLFVQRARAAYPGFALNEANAKDLAEIAYRLQGIPLAIELAAARMAVLSTKDILRHLDRALTFLRSTRRDAPQRHHTLRNAMEWSWDLLTPWERSAAAQLSVFAGGFLLDGGEAVVDLTGWSDAPYLMDVFAALREKSWLRLHQTVDGDIRFSMFSVVQEFAAEKLALTNDAKEAAERRHWKWYARLGNPEWLSYLRNMEEFGSASKRRRPTEERENILVALERAQKAGDLEAVPLLAAAASRAVEVTAES